MTPSPGRVVIAGVLDVAKVIMLPLVGGATVSFAIGGLTPEGYAKVVAGALIAWGVIDVWDGTAGLRSGIDRIRKAVCEGKAALGRSMAKTVFGLSSAALGSAGILMVR